MKQGIRILIVSLTLFIATTVGASAFSDTVNKDFIQESVNELKERVISDGYYAGYYTISDYEIYDNAKESGHIGVGDYGNLMFIYYYHENDELAERVEMDFELPYISYIQPEISIYYESPYYMVADANFDASKYEWDDIVSFTQTDGPSFKNTFVNEECSDRLYDALAFWNGMLLEKADLCLANIGFTSLCNKHDTDFINVKAATCTNDGYTGDEMCFICGEIVNTGEVVSAGHSIIIDKAVAATCEATGLTEGSHCSRCDFRVAQEVMPATGHSYSSYKTTKKAGFGTKGIQTSTCQNANCTESKTKSIPALKTPTLSTTTYTFNNKVKKPSVTVKNTAGTSISKTVSYASGRKAVGKYAVKVTVNTANYKGTKTVYFKINPAKPTSVKLTKGKKQFKVSWAKPNATYRNQITGYQVRYATSSSKLSNAKPITVKGSSVTSKTIKNLKAKKKYWVQVRTYKTVNGTKYYSNWSAKKYVTTK